MSCTICTSTAGTQDLDHSLTLRSELHRVDYLDEREAVEIAVAGADAADAVLAHEDGDMRVVNEIPGEIGNLGNDRLDDFGMARGRNENIEPR